jgi:hypothetical protein
MYIFRRNKNNVPKIWGSNNNRYNIVQHLIQQLLNQFRKITFTLRCDSDIFQHGHRQGEFHQTNQIIIGSVINVQTWIKKIQIFN